MSPAAHVWRRELRCDDLAEALAAAAGGDAVPEGRERAHVSGCLRCQADLVRYRRILRSMRRLRDEVIEPVPGLLPELLAAVHEAGERQAVRSIVSGRRLAYAGGVAAAGAGVAVGVGVFALHRRRRPQAGSRTAAAILPTSRA